MERAEPEEAFLRQVLHDDEIYPDFTILPGRRALEYVSNLSLLWDDSQDLLQTKNEKIWLVLQGHGQDFLIEGLWLAPFRRSGLPYFSVLCRKHKQPNSHRKHPWLKFFLKVQIQLNKGTPMNARFLRFHLRNNCNPAFSAKIALVCFFIRKLRSFNSKEFIIKLTRWLVTDRRELRLSLHKLRREIKNEFWCWTLHLLKIAEYYMLLN